MLQHIKNVYGFNPDPYITTSGLLNSLCKENDNQKAIVHRVIQALLNFSASKTRNTSVVSWYIDHGFLK